MIGQTISHYEILEKLGEVRLHPSDSGEQGGPTTLKKLELRRSGLARRLVRHSASEGGMGIVYKAREIALNPNPAELQASRGLVQFSQCNSSLATQYYQSTVAMMPAFNHC
jgi:hypothetical protein